MDTKINNQLITDVSWGHMLVGDKALKDGRLWPQHAEEWDWKKTGTLHVPGIQISDLADFIDQVDIVVLSEGVDGVLQIKPETVEYLKKLGKKYIIARTPEAIKQYNDLVTKGERVGALIHTTC